MATVYGNSLPVNQSEREAIDYLADALPGDYLLVPQVELIGAGRAPAIDLALILPGGLVAVEVRGWRGVSSGSPEAATVQVDGLPEPQRNPFVQALGQAQRLADYLREPEQAARFLDDTRARFGLRVAAAVLFTHPEADVQIAAPDEVDLLRLDKSAVAQLQSDAFGRAGFALHAHERERLARLLRREPADDEGDVQSGMVAGGRVEPAVLRPRRELTATDAATRRSQAAPPTEDEITRRSLTAPPPGDEVTRPQFVHLGGHAQPFPPQPAAPQPARRRMADAMWRSLGWFGTILDGFERRAERLVEPGAQPAGGRNIDQPRLAYLLEQELENTLVHMIKRTVAHNVYKVLLGPADFAQYEPLRALGEEELTNYLHQVVTARDYELPGALEVRVDPAPELGPGQVRVHSRIVAGSGGPTAELLPDGDALPFKLGTRVVTIGRSQENAVCVARWDHQQIVSRWHARVVREGERFVLYDGDGREPSTWGTFVNGERLNGAGRPLQHGDVIVLGRVERDRESPEGVRLSFRQSPEQAARPAR